MSEPVSPPGESAISVRVDQFSELGKLLEARTEREHIVLHVRFLTENAPRLTIGQDVDLQLASERFARPLDCAGRPIVRSQDAQHITYQFAVPRSHTRILGVLANRRGCIRVRPDERAPIQLVLRAHGTAPRRPLPVLDISGTGLGVVAPRVVENELVDSYRILLELRLPEDSERMEFEARICHRRLRGSYIQYGLEFDPSVEGFAALQDRIFRYAARREAEENARRSLASEERKAS